VADRVLGSVSKNAFGGNAGAGISFNVGLRDRALRRSAYHVANTKPTSTAVVPVSFGVR